MVLLVCLEFLSINFTPNCYRILLGAFCVGKIYVATNYHVEKKNIKHAVNPDNQCLVYDFDSIVAAAAVLASATWKNLGKRF